MSSKTKSYLLLLGFVLFFTGLLSLVLTTVGIEFRFLQWLSKMQYGWLAKFIITIIGFVMMVNYKPKSPKAKFED